MVYMPPYLPTMVVYATLPTYQGIYHPIHPGYTYHTHHPGTRAATWSIRLRAAGRGPGL